MGRILQRHKLEATGDAEHETEKEPAETRGTITTDLDLILHEDIWLWFVYSEPLSHILLSISPHHRAIKAEYHTLESNAPKLCCDACPCFKIPLSDKDRAATSPLSMSCAHM